LTVLSRTLLISWNSTSTTLLRRLRVAWGSLRAVVAHASRHLPQLGLTLARFLL
jgi:hypothetical protein